MISVQRLAGCDIALVRLFPVRYKPASGELHYASQLNVQLTLAPALTNAEPPLRPPTLSQAKSRVGDFVDNPELLAAYESEFPPATGAASEHYDYLLITSSNLASAFQPLVERKTVDGLAVKIEMMETITNCFAGGDKPEQIRNCIRHAYTNWGVSYVLLGGTTATVPCRYAFARADVKPQDSYVPCDLYYACLDGSWNANKDRRWGETTDGANGSDVDLLAEVYVGRASVATVAQVKAFVEKTVRYETQANPNATNALLMATYLGDFPTGPCQGSDMYEPLRPVLSEWQLKLLEDRPQKYPQWSHREAMAAMSLSPHVVLYNGHGDADIQMRMQTPQILQLTNQWPFLVCSVGCSAAEFDHGKFWADSFGETLINGGPHGAFAAILNSRVGWFDPRYPWKYSGEFQLHLFDELLRKGHTHLGQASQRAKEDLIGSVESEGSMTYRWCYYSITLLGDPHVPFKVPPTRPRALAGTDLQEARTHTERLGESRAPKDLLKSSDPAGSAAVKTKGVL